MARAYHFTTPDELPTAEELRQRLSYDPERGDVRRRVAGRGARRGVGSLVGSKTGGNARSRTGYLAHSLKCPDGTWRTVFLHRIIWCLVTGSWPEPGVHIDHNNENGFDNRWTNIFVVTSKKNMELYHQRKARAA